MINKSKLPDSPLGPLQQQVNCISTCNDMNIPGMKQPWDQPSGPPQDDPLLH